MTKRALVPAAVIAAVLAAAPAASANVTITSGPPQHSNSASAHFAFATNPSSATECKVDGGSFAGCTSPYDVGGLSEGAHTFAVRTVGGTTGTPVTYDWTIDLTPPDTTIVSGPSALSNAAVPQFAFSSNEPGTFQCSLDSAFFMPCTSPDALLALSDGQHAFAVRAVDQAGNVDPTPAVATWIRDTVAPAKPVVTIGPSLPVRKGASLRGFHAVKPNNKLLKTATFQLTDALQVQWRQPVAQRGSLHYAVSYEAIKPSDLTIKPFSPIAIKPGTFALRFHAAAGREYCFSVTASDDAGNTSPAGSACTTLPYKVTGLEEHAFSPHSGSGYYLGQYAQGDGGGYMRLLLARIVKKQTAPKVFVKHFALVATECPTCGAVAIVLSQADQIDGFKIVKPYAYSELVFLNAAKTKKKVIIPLKTFPNALPTRNYQVWIFGAGGQPRIEGIGVEPR